MVGMNVLSEQLVRKYRNFQWALKFIIAKNVSANKNIYFDIEQNEKIWFYLQIAVKEKMTMKYVCY